MRVDLKAAAVAGIAGAAAMAVVSLVARMLGMPIMLELLVGSLFTGDLSLGAWIAGFAMQLGIGAVFGMAYAFLFEHVFLRSGLTVGLLIGAVHAVVAGISLTFVPPTHPLVPDVLPAPGPFMIGLGVLGPVIFVGLHLMFGIIVGSVYAPASTSSFRREAHA